MIIRLLAAASASAFAFLLASCCCTSDPVAPPLRDVPQFQEVPSAPAPQVTPTK